MPGGPVVDARRGVAPRGPWDSMKTSSKIVHRARGAFGEFLVVDDGARRHLRVGGIDGIDQTVIERGRPGRLPTAYLRVATVGAALVDRLERVLLVGLGGGAYPRFLQRAFRGISADVLEVDPTVVRLAQDYFGFREGGGLRVFQEDAAGFVFDAAQDPAWKYDFVFLDAYHGQKIPSALARQNFFRRVAGLLNPGGVAVANVGLPERWQEDRVLRRFAGAFPEGCLELEVPDEDNRIAIGARDSLPGVRRLYARLRAIDTRQTLSFELLPFARTRRYWTAD